MSLGWQRRNWSRVLISGETKFNLLHFDGRTRVCRRRGERLAPNLIQELRPFGGRGVRVCGAIWNGQTRLVTIPRYLTAQRYRDEGLRYFVLSFLRQHQETVFQNDNARLHTARLTTDFLNCHNVDFFPCPYRLSDLSPIEQLWDILGRQHGHRQRQTNNVQ